MDIKDNAKEYFYSLNQTYELIYPEVNIMEQINKIG
jgi:hypothetical protein